MDPARNAWIARMEQLRARRATDPSAPTRAERARHQHDPAGLRRSIMLRTDPSLRTLMDMSVAALTRQRRELAAAASAWRDTVEIHMRDLGFPVTLLGVRRGVLMIVVADQAQRFLVEQKLRGGAKKHFQSNCRASIRDVRIVVGTVPDPIVPQERHTRTRDEAEQEIQDHLDAGLIAPEHAADLRESWRKAEREALERDAGPDRSGPSVP